MSDILSFLWAALALLLAENVVFARGIGTTLGISVTRGTKYVALYALGVTFMSVVASIPAWFLHQLLKGFSFYPVIEPLGFTLVLTAVYLLAHFILRFVSKVTYPRYSAEIAHMTFNCVAMAVLLIGTRQHMGFGDTLLFALETGLSFLVASLFLLEGQKRLAATNLPQSFSGLPAMLLYVGILSMAIYGFTGHPLPF